MTTPTPATLRAAREIIPLAVHILNGVMDEDEVAKIIDREGLREAAEALREIAKEHDGQCGLHAAMWKRIETARAALARLEATE